MHPAKRARSSGQGSEQQAAPLSASAQQPTLEHVEAAAAGRAHGLPAQACQQPGEGLGSLTEHGGAAAAQGVPVNAPPQEVDQAPPERVTLAALARLVQCPLSCAPMADPVIAADGHTYDRSALEAWLLRSRLSPVTGQVRRGARAGTGRQAGRHRRQQSGR